MANMPNEHLLRSELVDSLEDNIGTFRTILQLPDNKDVVERRLLIGGVSVCLFFMDGMVGNTFINDNVLQPLRLFHKDMPVPPEARARYLHESVLTIGDANLEDRVSELIKAVLDGRTVLLVDGCREAVVMETRFYERRPVGRTNTESVVVGQQQGFVENLRTNITLVRRIIRSPQLVSEMVSVGKQLPVAASILYLKGSVNPKALEEVKKRIKGLDVGAVLDSGHLRQLIEERPLMLLPQTIETERPDRAAYLIAEGRIAIMVDNSPYALIVPVSMFDLLRTSDDSYMRWQYAAFNRVIRFLGLMISLVLPGLYVAVTLFHSQMIPLELLASIAESRADVPFPVVVEVLIMEFSFYLINEAGTRMPSQIGSALGIVGALILGQAAVQASIISPLLIIIAAISGLGNYAIPDFGLGISVQLMRIGLLVLGATLGLFGLMLGLFLYISFFCSINSFGQPFMAPMGPWRAKNSGGVLRPPMWMENRMPYFVPGSGWLRRTPDGETMRAWEGKKK